MPCTFKQHAYHGSFYRGPTIKFKLCCTCRDLALAQRPCTLLVHVCCCISILLALQTVYVVCKCLLQVQSAST